MRKIVFLMFLVAFAINSNAQDGQLRVGGHIGVTTNGGSSFVVGGDVDYLFNAEDRFSVGAATGLAVVTDGNSIILPLAIAGRFHATSDIDLGLDMGYAIGINNSGNGFYFRPIFEYKLSNSVALRASYSGIGSGGYINAGFMFAL